VRVAVVAFGVVVILAGAVLWYVPLSSASTSLQVPVGDAYDFGVPNGYILGAIPYTASWASGSSTNVTIYGCGTNSACPNEVSGPVVAHADAATGSLKWTSSAGHFFLLVPNSTVNLTLSYLEPVAGGLVGIGMVGLGAIAFVVGLAVRKPTIPGAAGSSAKAGPSSPP
jgi:hypothetical protein